MFTRAITAQMRYWTESPESNCHIKALLEMLKRLHRVRVLLETHVSLFCSKIALVSVGLNLNEMLQNMKFMLLF